MRLLSSFICLILFCLSGSVSAQSVNPYEGNGRAIFTGGALFRAQCATCHGADAKGISSIDAPDLTLMWAERQRSIREVYGIIQNGVPGSIMPPHDLTEDETWLLVAYLQDVAVSGVIGLTPGNVENGQTLFAENCAECHSAKGAGGALGPNLSSITKRRSLESLMVSVRNPSALMRRGFQPLSIVTANNEQIQGVLKSEDAFSVQMMDSNQRLRAFRKNDLRELDRLETSLMPAFSADQLSDNELNDIFNYLDSP